MTIDYTQPPQPPQPPPQPGDPLQPGEKKKSSCCMFGLIGCAVILVIGGLVLGGLVYFVFGLIKSTEVYKQAFRRAATNPEVIARLGQPIERGWWVMGSVTVNDQSGSARFSFPIEGPKDKGTVNVEATRDRDRWLFSVLRVKPDRSGEIDLLASP